ncbi:MAG: FMN-binding protein [Niameybacter sp.]|uniref:FMN-binding protein n=1 Tax=Niameybacter sp. TaxID=2033640 RepID=UPI002FC9F131
MKNKKLLALICASIIAIGSLTACSSKEEPATTPAVETPAEEAATEEGATEEATALKDGSYKAEYTEADERGWKAFVEVTVEDGQMTAATFDYANAEGALKTADAEYNTKMKDIAGTSPAEFAPALAEALVASQDPTKVDVVTGATSSTTDFTTLATALMANIQEGNTEVLLVEAPAAE